MITIEKEIIEEKTRAIIVKMTFSEPEDIKTDSFLKDDLQFDSLEIAELCIELEKEFSMSIQLWEFEKLKTFGAVVEYLDSLLNPIGI